jgi:hypothetical protein
MESTKSEVRLDEYWSGNDVEQDILMGPRSARVRLRTLLEIYAGSPELLRHLEVIVLEHTGDAMSDRVDRGDASLRPHRLDKLLLERLANPLFRQSEVDVPVNLAAHLRPPSVR